MKLIKNESYQRKERKFFKKHADFYACSLTYEYRLVCSFIIQNDVIILVDIGTHDDVYY